LLEQGCGLLSSQESSKGGNQQASPMLVLSICGLLDICEYLPSLAAYTADTLAPVLLDIVSIINYVAHGNKSLITFLFTLIFALNSFRMILDLL
jgi:hypothetical protein